MSARRPVAGPSPALNLLVLLLIATTAGWAPARPWLRRSPRNVVSRAGALALAADGDGEPAEGSASYDEMQKALDSAQLENFNSELYAHLGKRPEYETTEMYSSLRKRIDVDDPLYSELKERRDMLSSAPLPSTDQTPGEVIELVLRALRDVDWPRPGHGAELLQNYSSGKSILGDDRPEVTPQMLVDYFASSKYSILLDWVSIQYLRKLELSFDRKRALQQLRLTTSSGESVSVTFQLSKNATPEGDVWLIDQLLVKS